MTLPLFNDAPDDTPEKEQEPGFARLNTTSNPAQVDVGTLARAMNAWMETDGRVNTRPGRRLVSDSQFTTGQALEGMLYFDTPTKEAVILPAGPHLWEIAGDTAPQVPTQIAADVFDPLGWKVQAQLIDRAFVANSINLFFAQWTGAAWVTGTVTEFSNANPMPPFRLITTHRFRLFGCPENSNVIYVSKFLQAHNSGTGGDWDELANIVVGTGNGDPTRAMLSGQQSDLIVLNEATCWTVDTSALDPADWEIRKLTGVAGCVARRTAVFVGQEVYFLSRYGLVTLSALELRETISAADTLTAPVNDVIERVNWNAVANERGASCTVWRNLILLAIPVDGATEANRVLAYNVLTKQWVSEWEYSAQPNLEVWGHACLTRFGGKQETLWALMDGFITRLDETYTRDDNPLGSEDIATWVRTRSLWFQLHEAQKKPFWLELEFNRSGAAGVSVLFVPDDEVAYPEIPIDKSRIIATNQSVTAFLAFPLTLPFTFSSQYTKRKAWHLRDHVRFREAQIIIHCPRGNLGLRKLTMTAFVDPPILLRPALTDAELEAGDTKI
jgi:hypothetical protein